MGVAIACDGMVGSPDGEESNVLAIDVRLRRWRVCDEVEESSPGGGKLEYRISRFDPCANQNTSARVMPMSTCLHLKLRQRRRLQGAGGNQQILKSC